MIDRALNEVEVGRGSLVRSFATELAKYAATHGLSSSVVIARESMYGSGASLHRQKTFLERVAPAALSLTVAMLDAKSGVTEENVHQKLTELRVHDCFLLLTSLDRLARSLKNLAAFRELSYGERPHRLRLLASPGRRHPAGRGGSSKVRF